MNPSQTLWQRQASSDYQVYELLRGSKKPLPPCHTLLHLQMASEKIAKAYFWQTKPPPAKSHAGLHRFMRILCQTPSNERQLKRGRRIAHLFGYKSLNKFQAGMSLMMPLAYALEQLAPALAADGPNLEYPWPHNQPVHVPAEYEFAVWKDLMTGQGRSFITFLRTAIERFHEYADEGIV